MGTFVVVASTVAVEPTAEEAEFLITFVESVSERFDRYRDFSFATREARHALADATRNRLNSERQQIVTAVQRELQRSDTPDWVVKLIAAREAGSVPMVALQRFLLLIDESERSGQPLTYWSD